MTRIASLVVASAALAGCTSAPSTQLSALTNAQLSLATEAGSGSAGPAVVVTLVADGCPTVADDLVVTYDDQPLTLVDAGGTAQTFDGPDCHAPSFALETAAATPGLPSALILRDASGTWAVSGWDLLTEDLVPTSAVTPGARATVAWPSAPSVDAAYVSLVDTAQTAAFAESLPDLGSAPAGALTGNQLAFDVPRGLRGYYTLTVDASRTAEATMCKGPASCALTVSAHAAFAASIL